MGVLWTNPVERGIIGLVTRYASARYDWFMVRYAAHFILEAKPYTDGQLGSRAPS